MAAIKNSSKTRSSLVKNAIAVMAIVLLFLVGTYFVYTFLPVHVDWQGQGIAQVGVDWKSAFRRACLELLGGKSPYNISLFYNPPWTLLPFLPIALLSPALGSAVMYVLNLLAYSFVVLRLKMNFWLIIPFTILSGIMLNSQFGNIEGILALGFILPPQVGLFFVLAKPQMGAAVAVFWLIEALRDGGGRKALKIFSPVIGAYLLSFLIFGFWIGNSMRVTNVAWNSSIWPWGILIGLILTALAIWKRELKFAIAASPFFTPYLVLHTWAVVWLGLLSLFPHNFRFPHNIKGFFSNQPGKSTEKTG
jgi:hypothetical protein